MANVADEVTEMSTTIVESTTDSILTTVSQLINATGNKTYVYSRTLNAYDYAIPIVGFLAIGLNLAVVVSSGLILKKGQMPKTTYILLGNVAMSDFLTAFSTVFGQLYPKQYREHYICCFQIGMIVSSTIVSVYSVGLIAIDRFLYITHGLKYQTWVYPSRIRIAIGCTWILGLVIGFLPLLGWNGDTRNGQKCWFILLAPKDLVLLTATVGAIPLVVVIVLYSIILYQALKNINRIKNAPRAPVETEGQNLRMFVGNPQQQNKNQPNKWRAIKVVLFTTGAFLFTWGPYFIACVIYVSSTNSDVLRNVSILIASPLAILGFCNTLIDPIIYAWWHKGFRNFVLKKYASMRGRPTITSSKDTSSTTAAESVLTTTARQ